MTEERRLFKEVKGEVSCRNVEPTKEELDEALAVEKERLGLEKIVRDAEERLAVIRLHPSRVFYDEGGFIYDLRTFIASGQIDHV